MSDYAFTTEYKTVNSKSILAEPSYQRPVDFARVKKIVANFNPNLVNPIKVSSRDGKYFVFDGQHTLRALVLRNNNKDLLVPCKVYYGMSMEDEARLFSEQNGISRAVSSAQKLQSLYVAGDVDVVGMKETVEALGIRCNFKDRSSSGRAIVCHKKAFDIYMKYGESRLTELLKISLEAWGGDADGLRGEIISGMNLFITTYENECDRKVLANRLQKVSPTVIIRDGKAMVSGKDKRYARIILREYNKGTRKKLDDKF